MLPAAWKQDDVWAPARLQLYVDDPTAVAQGHRSNRYTTFSLLILWWLVLGIPLSWKKGASYTGGSPYQWIGVLFTVVRPGVSRITLPKAFVDELIALCGEFLAKELLPLARADSLVGRAGRVAYVLPQTRPFVATLYAAMAATLAGKAVGSRESAPGHVACRRFRRGARMLRRILGFKDRSAPVPNSRDIFAVRPPPPDPDRRRIEVDASPWGGGAVLLEKGRPVRCFSCRWSPADFTGKKVRIGDPACQTFFEVLALVLAVELWCTGTESTTILGDNVASLQEALDTKGKDLHEDLAQALAILRCTRSLDLAVGHLPSEANDAADALSRQDGPEADRKPWPFTKAQRVMIDHPLRPSALWEWLR